MNELFSRKYLGVTLSGLFALFAFVYFFFLTAELLKSFAAAVFVFFLFWLCYVVIQWVFEAF